MRLHTKVLLVVIPLAVIPLLVLGWLVFGQLQQTGVERTTNQMNTLMDQLSDNYRVHVNVAEANVGLIANSSLMRAYALTDDEEERYLLILPSLLKLFQSYLRAYPDYYQIRYILTDGYEDARATLKLIPNVTDEEGDSAFFKQLTRFQGGTMSDVIVDQDTGAPSLQVARPLSLINIATDDPLGTVPKLRGYLVVSSTLDFLSKQVAANTIGRSGLIFVVNTDGKIIFHKDSKMIGKRIPPAQLVELKISVFEKSIIRATHESDPAFFKVSELDQDLLLVGMIPESELVYESRILSRTVALVMAISVLLTVAALFTATQLLMVRPLKSLLAAVKDVSEGKLDLNLTMESKDELGQLAGSFQNMGLSLQRSREKIERLAYHDSLTGLPNRLMFREYLQHMIAMAHREKNTMAVLFLDLDNFKRVNDTLGHPVGDRLLQEMAERLKTSLRAEDIISSEDTEETSQILARLGGDEFIILLPNIKGANDAAKVATRILEIMNNPFCFDGHTLYNGTSIGITLYPNDGTEVSDLIKRADVAMYHAKELGRNNFQFYSASYNRATTEHLSLENKLRRALENNEFELYYQPQLHAERGDIAGFEALIRWNCPEDGLIGPDYFIPIAEDSGLILPIGEWVLNEACRQLSLWHREGLTQAFVAVNVSGIQLQRQDFMAIINKALADYGLDHNKLEIELTETTLMKLSADTIDQLQALKELGVEISLDDFGTGYSSLNRLRELPIGKLKIDRSFVKDMLDDPQDAAIVSAIMHIANSMDLLTTAEGVESKAQALRLETTGCTYIQGYWFSKPIPANEIENLLRDNLAEAIISQPE